MVDSGGSWRDAYKGMSSDNVKGLVLALSSSLFIGASFIVKKKGLKKAGASGLRAGLLSFSNLGFFKECLLINLCELHLKCVLKCGDLLRFKWQKLKLFFFFLLLI